MSLFKKAPASEPAGEKKSNVQEIWEFLETLNPQQLSKLSKVTNTLVHQPILIKEVDAKVNEFMRTQVAHVEPTRPKTA